MADSPRLDPHILLSHNFPETTYTYTERDVALYALGVGACASDAVDADELKYVYHENGQQFIQVLPSFAALVSLGSVPNKQFPGLQFDERLMLHAQQYIEFYKPLPSSASLRNKVCVSGLHDKDLQLPDILTTVNFDAKPSSTACGQAALLEMETKSYDLVSGELLCMNRSTVFLRGVGGFSKSAGQFSYSTYPRTQVAAIKIPQGQPFCAFEDQTHQSQALLYRLSGDYNPLHSDPKLATVAGFSRPILHGLCTMGYAVRAVIKCICKGDPNKVKSIWGRFLLHVYPGETLSTEMWVGEGSRVIYQTKVKERNRAVLSGYVDLHRPTSTL